MARTRDLVALSAILLAPLALLLAQPVLVEQEPAAEPAPDIALEPPAVDAAPPVVAPPPVEPAPVVAEPPPVDPAPPAAEPPPVDRDPGQAMLLHHDALVLHSAAAPDWSSGKLGITAEPGHLRLTRPTRWDRLPGPVRALEAARVVVYAADGSSCVAAVGPARLQLEQHGEVFMDDDLSADPYDPPANKRVLRNMAQKSFENGGDLLLLAALGEVEGQTCRGLWARRADLPAPAVFGRRDLPDDEAAALTAAALAVVREQPEFAAMRTDYLEYYADISEEDRHMWPDWDALVAANFSAVRWDEVGGPRRIVAVTLRAVPEPCSANFDGGLALFLEQRDGGLVRLAQPGIYDIGALMDIDRDGLFEAVTSEGTEGYVLHAEGAGAAAFADSFSIPYYGCPC